MENLEKRLEGQKQTILRLKKEKAEFQKENARLQKQLGIFKSDDFIEFPSLPLIIIGAGFKSRPICEKHGEMLRFENDIWRCEACKTSVDLSKLIRFIQEEFDGVIIIK